MIDLDRAHILDAMASLATDTREDELSTFVLPPNAKRILDPSTVLVIGARGSGKSALARFLVRAGEELRSGVGPRQRVLLAQSPHGALMPVEGFSQWGTAHPDAAVLDALVSRADDDALRTFWLVWLFLRIVEVTSPEGGSDEVSSFTLKVKEIANGLRIDPMHFLKLGAMERVGFTSQLDGLHKGIAERAAGERRITITAVYDDLDLVGTFDPTLRARFLRALLTMWASFSTRYRHLSAKIFLPADLFDLRQFDTVDVSKLMARAERLEWDVPSLYRLVLRHLAQKGEAVRAWLTSFGMGFKHLDADWGWMPDEVIPDDAIANWLTVTLRSVVAARGTRAPVLRWIANRLRDGRDRIAPRSMLGFFREAARIAQRRPPRAHWNHILSVDDAVEALDAVGAQRVDEIRAVYEWVDRLEALRGRVMPIARTEIEALLERDPQNVPRATRDRDGRSVTRELRLLGLLRDLNRDDLLDMPDLFAGYFGVLRQSDEAERSAG